MNRMCNNAFLIIEGRGKRTQTYPCTHPPLFSHSPATEPAADNVFEVSASGENENHSSASYEVWPPVAFVVTVVGKFLIYDRFACPGVIRRFTTSLSATVSTPRLVRGLTAVCCQGRAIGSASLVSTFPSFLSNRCVCHRPPRRPGRCQPAPPRHSAAAVGQRYT